MEDKGKPRVIYTRGSHIDNFYPHSHLPVTISCYAIGFIVGQTSVAILVGEGKLDTFDKHPTPSVMYLRSNQFLRYFRPHGKSSKKSLVKNLGRDCIDNPTT